MSGSLETPSLEIARERAEKALRMPIGIASPLWAAFGAAASVGVAWWWMTRWSRPANLEAMFGSAAPAAEEAVEAIPVPVPVSVAAVSPPVEEPASEPAIDLPSDDLTRLVGIGPKLAVALAARGVTRFQQIAEWTQEDLDSVDFDLKLLGRATRDAWVAQAATFAAKS